ncbi:MAG: hypothetical protein PWQ37_257 [Candidatus Petromonas sp.]|jgi:hypothetical protein|nr:hypothetical protein [Candidatus Petromonas sp.]
MIYKKNSFIVDSDFDIRTVREEGEDIDLFLPIGNRTVNLYLNNSPDYLNSRLQFPMVRNVILRFCTSQNNNVCTVHLLRNIDLQSSVVNFEVDYTKHYISLRDTEYFAEMKIKNKK